MTIPKSYEALADDLAYEKIISKTLLGQKEAYMMLADKGGLDLSESKAREAALREELDNVRDDLIIFKSAVSALGEASKKLVFYARTSGGTAGPDQGLMDACAGVEGVITLGGIARAMNEFERLTAERDDLAARLEQARDRKNSIVDLQQRLTVSEQRAGELETALINVRETLGREYWDQYAGLDETRDILDAALKPAAEVEALGARPVGCCCPPKGHNGIWAAAMCPVHFGLKRPGIKP